MEAALKAALFVGAVLLLGAGLFARWVGPELSTGSSRTRLRWSLGLGAALLIVAGFAEVAVTVNRAFASLDAFFFREYLQYTRHGHATLARGVLALLLGLLGLGALLPRRLDRALWALLSLGVLGSLSIVSHSGVLGTLPFLGDLAHLVGATLWAGALLYFAFAPDWRSSQSGLALSVRRVSSLGVFAVLLLTLTGVYTATLHLYAVGALTRTAYGLALVVKVLLVVIILGIAAANRWLLMPRLARGDASGLRRAVRLEAVLLLGVLVATGVLATREPAHEHPEHHAAHPSLGESRDAHPASAPQTQANVMTLGAAPVVVEALPLPEGGFALVLQGDALTPDGFALIGPDGSTTPQTEERPSHAGSLELWLALPDAIPGRYALSGPSGERFSFVWEQVGGYAFFFLPAPSVSSGGLSEVFVYAAEGAPIPRAISLQMPGMAHAGDHAFTPLERRPEYHDARASAQRAALAFPVVGSWGVTLIADADEGAAFTLEVTEE